MSQINLTDYPIRQDIGIFLVMDSGKYSQDQASKLFTTKDFLMQQQAQVTIVNTAQTEFVAQLNLSFHIQYGLVIAQSNGHVVWQVWNFEFDDCAQIAGQFLENFREADQNLDVYKWGNRIQAQGDYLCIDCGYILTVDDSSDHQVGDAFPSCEVCQAGEPGSTTAPNVAFWQKL